MNHVFLFSSYSNIENMAKVISTLNHPEVKFVIHINKKVNLASNDTISQLNNMENVFFIEDREKVEWGGFSHLKAIIKLMKKGMEISKAEYFHLLSDACFPIKPIHEIVDFFEKNKGKEFIDHVPLPNTEWAFGGLNRIEYYHLHDILPVKNRKLYWKINELSMLLQKHLGLKRNIGNYKYYGGSTWWSLSQQAVQYCLDEIADTPGFYKMYRHSFAYEESCFQTILLNSPFSNNIVNDDLRYVDWNNRNGNLPANLDETDFDILITSTDLFARKFVSPTGDALRELLQNSFKKK